MGAIVEVVPLLVAGVDGPTIGRKQSTEGLGKETVTKDSEGPLVKTWGRYALPREHAVRSPAVGTNAPKEEFKLKIVSQPQGGGRLILDNQTVNFFKGSTVNYEYDSDQKKLLEQKPKPKPDIE